MKTTTGLFFSSFEMLEVFVDNRPPRRSDQSKYGMYGA